MCRVNHKKTYAAHIECSYAQHIKGRDEATYSVMKTWGIEYLKSCGWKF